LGEEYLEGIGEGIPMGAGARFDIRVYRF